MIKIKHYLGDNTGESYINKSEISDIRIYRKEDKESATEIYYRLTLKNGSWYEIDEQTKNQLISNE